MTAEIIPIRPPTETQELRAQIQLLLPHGPSYTSKGECKNRATLANLITILERDPDYVGRWRLDELAGVVTIDGQHPLSDAIEARLSLDLAYTYAMDAPVARIHEAICSVAEAARYHPVRDYLTGLRWDGAARLDGWLTDLCGVEDTPMTRTYARRWAVSCVARVMQPGCQVDTVLILAGPQGLGKSSIFRVLGGDWYSEGAINVHDSKGSAEMIRGKWIFELGELDSMRRADATAMKAFVTTRADRYRPAYGRNAIDQPRQTVFVGTTNEEEFLTDSTGNRRYWPVRVARIDVDRAEAVRDALWAEAYAAWAAGEPWWLSAEEEADRGDDLEQYSGVDPYLDEIAGMDLPDRVTSYEVAQRLKLDASVLHSGHYRRIASALQAIGYKRAPRGRGRREWVRD